MVATAKRVTVEHLVSATLMVTVAARDDHVEAIVTPTHSSAEVAPGYGWSKGRTAAQALLLGVLDFIERVGLAGPEECEALRSAITAPR